MSERPLLEVDRIGKRFGGVSAVDECSLFVPHDAITGLIGPNGSGKTTVFNIITGFVGPDVGEVWFRGKAIHGLAPGAVYKMGIGRTFQSARVFTRLTAIENLLVPVRLTGVHGFVRGFRGVAEAEMAHDVLTQLGLSHVAHQQVGRLSYGQRRLVELGTVMMCNPRLVLLDEPTAGVHPSVTHALGEYVLARNGEGVSFLIVEHNLNFVTSLCHHLVVLDHGRQIAQGTPAEVVAQQAVVDAYLGD